MSETHTPGQTTQPPQRPPQDVIQPVHHLDLDEECARLLQEASTNPSHRAAKTLSKDSSMSVAIVAITGGTEIKDHSAHCSALLQTLRGQVSISLKDTEVQLLAGQVVTLASQVPHGLRATVDSVVLLVVAGDK